VAERCRETTGRRRGRQSVVAVAAVVAAVALPIAGLADLAAGAEVGEPTTTTEPAPEPTTTTEPVPDPTSTTEPAPDPTSTTEPAPDPTSSTEPPPEGIDPQDEAGTLEPGEALVRVPEFAALSSYQRALVGDLQTATDAYALRRFALVDIVRQAASDELALAAALEAEGRAVMRELVAPVEASSERASADEESERAERAERDDELVELAVARRLLATDRKRARRARVQAEAAVAVSSALLAAQVQEVADALAVRSAAESAIERELGPGAVRARPDGITATLAAAQAGQPDAAVVVLGEPVPGAALSSPFGLRNDPLSNGAGFHAGFDLAARSGTSIHAAAAGVVVVAGDCGGYGNCVVIDHGNSLATVSAHQSDVLVRVGEEVAAGQIIGIVGSTGMSTGPHLHFEVRVHGLAVDPVLALPSD
jgi:murein DD-endopeptidase MepM/ murein hydrolase activator NlpD